MVIIIVANLTIQSWAGYLIFPLLFYYPIYSADTHKIALETYGIVPKKPFKIILITLVTGIVIFIPFIFGFHYFIEQFTSDQSNGLTLYPHFWEDLINQLLVVGIAEEFFYRGYLQTLFQKRFKQKIIPALHLDMSVVLVSLLFGMGHFFTYGTLLSILTFFPSLLFGMLKNATGSIYASAVIHGVSNIVLHLLIAGIA